MEMEIGSSNHTQPTQASTHVSSYTNGVAETNVTASIEPSASDFTEAASTSTIPAEPEEEIKSPDPVVEVGENEWQC